MTAMTVNWTPAIFAGVVVVCLGFYWGIGRRVYKGPVVFVEGKRRDGEVQGV